MFLNVADPYTHYAYVNAFDGIVTRCGKGPASDPVPTGATIVSADHYATIEAEFAEGRQCRLVNGVLMHQPLPHMSLPPLDVLQRSACAEIDQQAEAARAAFLTAGAGQRAEYDATAHEAALVQLIPCPEQTLGQEVMDPDDYPHLQAEVAALGAVGIVTTVRQVANAVLEVQGGAAVSSAWIKQVRRTAKLRVAAVTSAEAVAAVLDGLDWTRPR